MDLHGAYDPSCPPILLFQVIRLHNWGHCGKYCLFERFLNTTYLFILILAGIWRGGSYYIFKFSKIYNNKFEPPAAKKEE